MLLTRLVDNLAISIEPFALREVACGRTLSVPDVEAVTIHFVLDGSISLTAGSNQVLAAENSLVVVPAGLGQIIEVVRASSASGLLDAPPELERLQALGVREVPDAIAACGRVEARYGDGPALFAHLTVPLVVDFGSSQEVRQLFGQILQESGLERPGSQTMLRALMNRCLVMMFRLLCDQEDCPLPWLVALEDERLSAALDEMLLRPGSDHSVESLAETAAMSRTVFAESFKTAFGQPPMTFLRDVRLRRAAQLLRDTELGIGTIAARVGFASRAHFSTAFSRKMGVAPGHYRNRTTCLE